jgi:L-fuconolactonase
MRIDAHQHFWKFDSARDSWITEEMSVIRKDFLPADLEPILKENDFDGCVAIQADQSEDETIFLLELASQNEFIKGIVGWVDLCDEKINDRLAHYKQFDSLKGFRHILQGESERDFMLKPEFMRGVKALKEFDFTYDILVFPDQLQYIKIFSSAFPGQKFVVDHMAKPYIKDKKLDDWKRDITAVAEYENIYCKISGLVMEADWKSWREEDFIPYIDVVVDAFGINRVMFGSDWPVCLPAASYKQVLGIVKKYFTSFTENEQQKFFGSNAVEFYNLK